MNPDRAAFDLSIRQGGVLRRDQAIACGLTDHQIDHRIRDARWRRIGRLGYRVVDMEGPLDLVRAAVAALPTAVASHQAAAELHAIPRVPRGVAVVSVHSQTTHSFPGVIVRRNHDLAPEDVVEVDDLSMTGVARTIVDLAAIVSWKHLEAVIDDSLAAGLVSIAEITEVRDRIARRGKPGITALRKVLDSAAPGPRLGTALERLGAKVLIDGGLPEPEYEYQLPWEEEERRFDTVYADQRLAIEWDSREWHLRADAFQRDRERDRAAMLHGWRVLRFTWNDLTERPEEVVATVRAALASNPGF